MFDIRALRDWSSNPGLKAKNSAMAISTGGIIKRNNPTGIAPATSDPPAPKARLTKAMPKCPRGLICPAKAKVTKAVPDPTVPCSLLVAKACKGEAPHQ